ncbi:MAG: PDZ domain-containing protein [Anaerolineae bacterium]|nr:PDZ domain-containing protein [Anaerolineae bacterium]
MRKFIVFGGLLAVMLVVAAGAIVAQDTEADSSDESSTAWLGIALVEADDQVVIARVQSGSPADEADLATGDVIVSFDGETVTSASGLTELVQSAAAGDTVTIEVLRDDETLSLDVTLGSVSTATGQFGRGRGFGFAQPEDVLGVTEMLLHADVEEADDGYEVVDVFSLQNPFELAEGDLVTAINGQAVNELDFQALMTDMMSMDEPVISLTVLRDGEEITLESDMMGMHFGFDRGFGFGRGRDFGGQRGPGRFRNLPDNSDAQPESTPPVTEETGQA